MKFYSSQSHGTFENIDTVKGISFSLRFSADVFNFCKIYSFPLYLYEKCSFQTVLNNVSFKIPRYHSLIVHHFRHKFEKIVKEYNAEESRKKIFLISFPVKIRIAFEIHSLSAIECLMRVKIPFTRGQRLVYKNLCTELADMLQCYLILSSIKITLLRSRFCFDLI